MILENNVRFQLQYFILQVTEQFIPIDSREFELCRLQVTNSTETQLRHALACLASDLKIIHDNQIEIYRQYSSNCGWLWPIYGKENCH